jgi:2-succinyl-5-enolpyruvyl-6-hydroxy-3-cyclohexene-1-carboxylate synthase
VAILQPIVNIAEICARKGVNNFILSPGSRCAPLTIALARHPHIITRSISDERTAAFVALGMAQYTRQIIGLVCTSGTAVLNYSPAVAEAYYQHLPLLLLTADRPPEWVEQQDGQTINQRSIFGPHVKASFELPADYTHVDAQWHVNRIINEAINLSMAYPQGPVHVNVPLREPFYPSAGEELQFEEVRVIEEEEASFVLDKSIENKLLDNLASHKNILIVAGQVLPDPKLTDALRSFAEKWQVPVVADIISNASLDKYGITHQDGILMSTDEALKKSLQPDLLITFGNSVISKNLKLFLRKYAPAEHWHIQAAGKVADTFQTLTRIVRLKPADFLASFAELHRFSQESDRDSYIGAWQKQNNIAASYTKRFLSENNFGEFQAVQLAMKAMPAEGILHLANSMAVRYANFIGAAVAGMPAVYANRGTSGIDGSNSTAVGAALCTDKLVTLITGDVAFFYDRNAFWLNFLPANLRVVLLNNHGGGIFRMIDGPGKQPELDEYFETRQLLDAERTAADAGMEYIKVNDKHSLAEALSSFYSSSGRAKVLEIQTDSVENTKIFRDYKAGLQR